MSKELEKKAIHTLVDSHVSNPEFKEYLHKLIEKQPEVDEELIRKTAKYIVEHVFEREYTFDNSQTQRAIKEMLTEAGVKVVPGKEGK